jgi:hypothetical protein
MRALFIAVTVAASVGLGGMLGASGAVAAVTDATAVSDAVKGVVMLEQRCRCVERRWNGSCKLRVCRDRW